MNIITTATISHHHHYHHQYVSSYSSSPFLSSPIITTSHHPPFPLTLPFTVTQGNNSAHPNHPHPHGGGNNILGGIGGIISPVSRGSRPVEEILLAEGERTALKLGTCVCMCVSVCVQVCVFVFVPHPITHNLYYPFSTPLPLHTFQPPFTTSLHPSQHLLTEATRSRLLRLEKEKHTFRPQLYKLPKHVVPRRREGNMSQHTTTGEGNKGDERMDHEGGSEGAGLGIEHDDFSLLHDLPREGEKTGNPIPTSSTPNNIAQSTATTTAVLSSKTKPTTAPSSSSTTNPTNPSQQPTLKPKTTSGSGGGGGSGLLTTGGSSSSSSTSSPKKQHWNSTNRIKHPDDNIPASLYTPSISITQTLRHTKPVAILPPPPAVSRINKSSYVSSMIQHHTSHHHSSSAASSSSSSATTAATTVPPSHPKLTIPGTNNNHHPATNLVVYSTNLSSMNAYGLSLRTRKIESGGGLSGSGKGTGLGSTPARFEGMEQLSNLSNFVHQNHNNHNNDDLSTHGNAADETVSLPRSTASSRGTLILPISNSTPFITSFHTLKCFLTPSHAITPTHPLFATIPLLPSFLSLDRYSRFDSYPGRRQHERLNELARC